MAKVSSLTDESYVPNCNVKFNQEISKVEVCRGCLDNNVDMYCISNTIYQGLYEKLSNSKLEDGLPEMFCYICYSLLKKCTRFSNMVQQSQVILAKLHHDGIEINKSTLPNIRRPKSNLTATKVENLSLINGTSNSELMTNIKAEELSEDLENDDYIEDFTAFKSEDDDLETSKQNGVKIIKTHNISVMSDSTVPNDDFYKDSAHTHDLVRKVSYISSDEDDEPVAKLKEGKQKINQLKELNVTQVFIDYQEQKKHMLNRSESDNYRLSKYKCNLCFRGYINLKTYTKHLLKHDERFGEYECDLCHFRYKNLPLLRKHIDEAHARFFKCNTCGILVHTSYQAKQHNKEHKGVIYPCKLCGKQFRKRTTYLSHTRIHHPSYDYVCKLCGCNFVNQLGLKLHHRIAHKNEEESATEEGAASKCVLCNIEFLNVKALYRHRLTSEIHKELHSETSKLCYVCEKVQPNIMNLNKHIIIHKKELLSQGSGNRKGILCCKQCPVKVTSHSNLSRHVQNCHSGCTSTTTSTTRFICEVCGTKRNSHAALCAHQRLHTGERPYKCPSCTKTFSDNNRLKLHYRVHSGERPYTCDRCSKQFAQKTALNRHMRVHTGIKPFTCHLCSKSFSQSNSCKTHINTVHLKLPTYKQKKKEILLKNNKINLDFTNL